MSFIKKFIVFLFFSLVPLLSQSPYIRSTLPIRDGIIYNPDSGRPFSELSTEYFDNGQIKYIGYLKNNKFHGFGTEYLEDGKVKYRGEWENGKYHGKGTLYDEDGFVDHKGEFIDGEIE